MNSAKLKFGSLFGKLNFDKTRFLKWSSTVMYSITNADDSKVGKNEKDKKYQNVDGCKLG